MFEPESEGREQSSEGQFEGQSAGRFAGQAADDQRVIDDLSLGSLIYGWHDDRPSEPVHFDMDQHAWELYRLPEDAHGAAQAALAKTSHRQVHWLLEWPGRDCVLLRRPPRVDFPAIGGWERMRRRHELEQRMRDSVATVARLDETLERVEVLEPLYVERTHLPDRDWERTVALLSDGKQIATCPWDWYEFIIGDFVASCTEAVRREQ
ncbi:hypothetical protein SAMN04487968_10134 [Nocardioides terrae]|uniref:Uncharacterized protein n=1 Tax=Nocardioides terrae TaxID=574651 RepID=A0A1I1DAX0_9ACTN|nr:hypothetical protein [Nocardioides terrae]SFB70228.1 hypothetical protein SAMN04487968_10134 [Nocardioides terrae]